MSARTQSPEASPPPPCKHCPSEEDPLLYNDGKGPPTHRLLLMTIFAFPMSVIWATMGMVVLPAEALWLFPGDESLYLGLFLAVVGFSQLVCPVAGLLSDRCRSRFGRRRPFIFVGTIAAIIAIAGMWWSSVHRMPSVFFLGLFCSMTALNIISSAQASIVPDLNVKKGEASGVVSSLQLGGNLVGMVYILLSAEHDFHDTYLVYLLMLSAAGATVCAATRERPTDQDPPNPLTWQALRNSFWIDLDGDRDFFWVFVGRTLFYMATACQTFIYYYLRDLMLVQSESAIRWRLAVLALIATLLGLCTSYPLGQMSDRWGRKNLVYYACGCMSLAYAGYAFCPLLGPHHGMMWVYMLAGLYGLGYGGYVSVDYALALDCLPEKAKGSSEALGLWGIAGFIGSALGPLAGGLILALSTGWDVGQRPEKTHGNYDFKGYAMMLLMGSACCLLSAYFTSLIQRAR